VDLSLNTRTQGEHTILEVSGEVDVYTAPALRDRVTDLLDAGQQLLVIDLGGVEFLDSTGLGVLVGALKRVRSNDGDLYLVCTQPRIRKVFEVTGLTKVFSLFDTVDDAVAQ
jgi:anti-sigma B factor antagonist